MRSRSRRSRLLARTSIPILAAGALFAACEDDPVEPAGPIDVTINFAAQVNGAAFSCGTSYDNVGMSATTITLVDYRFYVHDVRLIDDTGAEVAVELTQDGQWQLDDLVLLDFEDGSTSCVNGTPGTNTVVRGQVPAGTYDGIRFRLGVPFELNHQDQTVAPPPLDLSGLFWVWNAGYKFARIDHTSAARPDGWNVHLGSTGCTPTGDPTAPATSCANEHRPALDFASFDFTTNTIVADYGRLLAGSDVTVNAESTASGCQAFPGDADCPPVMNRFGLDYEGSTSSGQTFFSVN